ncbi:MAG: DEAD/DEAH box helicase [Planctomycetaceae bacterium]
MPSWHGSRPRRGCSSARQPETGKTIIAEAALFEALHTGKTAYYTTPLIALTEQKFREMQTAAVRWGYSADDVGLVTGNRRVNPDARILVVVAEILLNRLLHPEAFDFKDVSAVVMDEFHSFNDPERGVVWELSLALLPAHVRLLLLSATVGNTPEFRIWLRQSHGRLIDLVQSTERKIPLTFQWVGDQLLSEQLEEMASGDDQQRRTPALLFCFNRAECWNVAELLKGKSLLADGQKKQLADAIEQWDWSLGAGPKLKPILMRGVGVHHAGLLPKYRRRVEELFQQKLLSVCVCTETLAAGINLPARSVVLTTLMKGPPGKQKVVDPSNAHQMFGRAGRPQFDDAGYVYVLAHEDDVKYARWKQQYDQIPEDARDPQLIQAKKRLKKKMPKHRDGVQYWTEQQFDKLVESPPAKLASRGELPWRLLAYLLTISPEVNKLREFVRKRLLDDAGRERAVEQLHRMLLTLWAAGDIDLQPLPSIELKRERRPLVPTLDELVTSGDQPSNEPATGDGDQSAVAEASSGEAIEDDAFGIGVGDDDRDSDKAAASSEGAIPVSAGDLTGASRSHATEDAEEIDGSAGIEDADDASGPASQGTFGALLQEALQDVVATGTAKGKPGTLSAAAKRLIEQSATKEVEAKVEYVPDRAYPNESLGDLLVFRGVNPLYGRYLTHVLGIASKEERVQAIESVLELPGSLLSQVRVPPPEVMPPGPLARQWLDREIVARGLASHEDLYPKSFEEEDDPLKKFGGPRRRFAIPLADKLRMLFDSEYRGVSGLNITPCWVVGDLLQFHGDFQKYVTSRDLTRQEGLIFRHLLRMILVCEEFAQLTPPGLTANEWQSELREILTSARTPAVVLIPRAPTSCWRTCTSPPTLSTSTKPSSHRCYRRF